MTAIGIAWTPPARTPAAWTLAAWTLAAWTSVRTAERPRVQVPTRTQRSQPDATAFCRNGYCDFR